MGRKVNDWAWQQQGLSMPEKMVLVCLAQYADNDTAECWPSIEEIAERCGAPERTVRRHRKALEQAGVIAVSRRHVKGRKRSTDLITIVGYQPAKMASRTRASTGHIGHDLPANADPSTGQIGQRSNKGTSQGAGQGTTQRAREAAAVEIEGEEVTDRERDIAEVVIAEFNERNGSDHPLHDRKGRATRDLLLIVARIRDDPELTPQRHRQIVAYNFDAPWWSGPAGSVAVIYSEDQWTSAKANTGRGKRKSYERSRSDPRRAKAPW